MSNNNNTFTSSNLSVANSSTNSIVTTQTEFTEIKRITDPQQIKERREKEFNEQARLLKFELSLQLQPFYLIGMTECVKQIFAENRDDRIMLGDYHFVKPISRTLQFGCQQKVKLFVRFVSPSDAKQMMSTSSSNLLDSATQSFSYSVSNLLQQQQQQPFDSNLLETDTRIVCESDEFTIADLLMMVPDINLTAQEIMDYRMHSRVISFNKLLNHHTLQKDSQLPKVICQLITPPPRDHIVERETTETGHIIIKDISQYGEVESKRFSITLKLQIRDCPAMDRFSSSSSNPYFIVYKDGVKFKQRLYTSEVKKKTLNSTYRVFSFDIRDGKIEFRIINPDTPNAFRGTMHVLKYEERIWMLEDVTQKFKSKKTGHIKSVTCRFYKNDFSIMNYLGWYELRLCFGIDFTSSNGVQPNINKRSLHYIGSSAERKQALPLNPYEVTMVGIMRAIYQYGYQREMKMYGFGALNPNVVFEMQEKKRVARESGIKDEKTMLHTYRRTVKKVMFGLDNNFTKIIAEVAAFAERLNHYFACVIITDGDEKINTELTLQLLKQSQFCGVSFIFVGVGNKSLFKNLMSFQTSCRNVSFVKFNENMELNALHALREVPQHMREYLAQRKVVPEEY
ncbi:hypothetical protein C9374_006387 [Naegleria lovaniensis]|uniref:Copine C-terminal domain-containing protein n=1 Tax=Naegleria lovaniensis TaxID=51637 RepID=A0AA88GMR3_NAELO|nr:uncharacterized protein C9374_006387 [Naegleria lovaniensis]KAG2381398.1 hypothetical protein C9374_006387 [Naegleria lovaniensis]